MDVTDGPSRLRRLLRSAGAAAAIAAVAGCSSAEPEAPTGSPSPTVSESLRATPTPHTRTSTCADRAADIDRSIAAIEAEIAAQEAELERDRRRAAELRAIRDQYPGGWSDGTVERARSTGLAIRKGVIVLQFESGGGTGWFIDEHHVVTNSHVAGSDGRPTGWTVEGERVQLRRIARDQDLSPDVAVLRTDFTGTPLSTGSSTDLDPGTPVVQVGHPIGAGNWLISLGHYLYREKRDYVGLDPTTVMYSSVPGRQGVSGAPVATLDGTIVGLTYGASPRKQGGAMGEAPQPAEPDVLDYEIAPKVWGNHVPIEIVRDHYEEWA